MSREEHVRQSVQLAGQLADLALAQGDHVLALDALLTAYGAIASAHPCCIESASRVAEALSHRLRQIASVSQLPPSPHVH